MLADRPFLLATQPDEGWLILPPDQALTVLHNQVLIVPLVVREPSWTGVWKAWPQEPAAQQEKSWWLALPIGVTKGQVYAWAAKDKRVIELGVNAVDAVQSGRCPHGKDPEDSDDPAVRYGWVASEGEMEWAEFWAILRDAAKELQARIDAGVPAWEVHRGDRPAQIHQPPEPEDGPLGMRTAA